MKTKKLKYTPEFNFALVGISSSDDDYKLSWHLSEVLLKEFVRCDDLEIRDSRFSEFLFFSIYEIVDHIENENIRIVSNKAKGGFLIDELKNIDYFILIYDYENLGFIDDLINKLKAINSISAVFRLNPGNLKSREKLLF
ncbi:MAG TPA: IPExxxVDY family protein [Bacteroidales bacterium]|nr:IPExxxVDY family protein [Bacteroidales bacterium]